MRAEPSGIAQALEHRRADTGQFQRTQIFEARPQHHAEAEMAIAVRTLKESERFAVPNPFRLALDVLNVETISCRNSLRYRVSRPERD